MSEGDERWETSHWHGGGTAGKEGRRSRVLPVRQQVGLLQCGRPGEEGRRQGGWKEGAREALQLQTHLQGTHGSNRNRGTNGPAFTQFISPLLLASARFTQSPECFSGCDCNTDSERSRPDTGPKSGSHLLWQSSTG